jgi:hypothetical protein
MDDAYSGSDRLGVRSNGETIAKDFSSKGQPGMKQNKQCPEGLLSLSESGTEWQSK